MKKRMVSLLLCAAMLLALLGCTTASAKSVDLMQGVEPLPVEPEGAFSREGAAAITRFGLQLLGGTLDGEGSNAMVSPLSPLLSTSTSSMPSVLAGKTDQKEQPRGGSIRRGAVPSMEPVYTPSAPSGHLPLHKGGFGAV